MLLHNCMIFFLLWNMKEDILRKVNKLKYGSVPNILQNIFFCDIFLRRKKWVEYHFKNYGNT